MSKMNQSPKNNSPRKSEKQRDNKRDPFKSPAIEKRYVIDDDDQYDNQVEEENNKKRRSMQSNKRSSQNSPKAKSPKTPLSPRKREILQIISKLKAELKDLESSAISGINNENSESYLDLTGKINAKKDKINELERLAELDKLEQKEESNSKELRRRIEILEKNQEELMSPKPKPKLGFMSPRDAIVSIKAESNKPPEEEPSLIERRNQPPLNVDVPSKTSQKSKGNSEIKEREVQISSSEKQLSESSFCKLNPIDAKKVVDKELQKAYSDRKNSKQNSINESLDQPHHSKKDSKIKKSATPQSKPKEKVTPSHYRSSHPTKNAQTPQKSSKRQQKQVTTRAIDLPKENMDFSVDVTLVEILKIPDISSYCVVYTETTQDSPIKTKVVNIEDYMNKFNENFHFVFNQSNPKSSILVFLIKKEDLVKGDKLIGSVKVDLAAVIRSMNKKKVNVIDKAFPIFSDTKMQTEGRLHIIFKSDCVSPEILNILKEEKLNKEKMKKEKLNKEKISKEKPKEAKEKKPEQNISQKKKEEEIDNQQLPKKSPSVLSKGSVKSESKGNSIQESNTKQSQTQDLELESVKKPADHLKVQPNLKSSIVSLLSDQSASNKAPNDKVTNRSTPVKAPSSTNGGRSPHSPKYNWNNGSILHDSLQKQNKPLYTPISATVKQSYDDDDDFPDESTESSDSFDENQPCLTPTSFPIPKIEHSAEVASKLDKEKELQDQLNLSLQEILEQTGSPVKSRDVALDFENAFFEEEEEEKNDDSDNNIEAADDAVLETVSEDEDQISQRLDKAFGKEPPKLSGDVEFDEEKETFNLTNLAKYFEPRFIDNEPEKRRNERKFMQKYKERSVNIEDDSSDMEQNDETQSTASSRKRQRITKVEFDDDMLDENKEEEIMVLTPKEEESQEDEAENSNSENSNSDQSEKKEDKENSLSSLNIDESSTQISELGLKHYVDKKEIDDEEESDSDLNPTFNYSESDKNKKLTTSKPQAVLDSPSAEGKKNSSSENVNDEDSD